MSSPRIVLAVSGHGFGHAVRSAEVARALIARGAQVIIRSDAPAWLFPADVKWLPRQAWPLDIGVVQHDGLELDIDATRHAWREFARDFVDHADAEADLIAGADALIGDIPPLAFAAASRARIPSYALTNFGWDWIYAAWPDFEDIVECVRQAYAATDVLLRLPLHAPDAFPAFNIIEDVPLIARRATRARQEVRRALRVASTDCLVLLSFGGFNARGLALESLGAWSRYTFVVTPPTCAGERLPDNVLALNETPRDYVSLLAACDVVVTKPGYGIVADSLANRVPVLFTDRGPFREYEVLADALPRLGPALYVPREDLIAGEVGPYLDRLLAVPARWTEQVMDGADVVADRVLHNLVGRCS